MKIVDQMARTLENSAEGKVIFDVPQASIGKLVHNLKWVFKDGRIASLSASRNVRALKDFNDKAGGDKDRICYFGIGINPNCKAGFPMSSIAYGAVTIGIGENLSHEGRNKSDYESSAVMAKPTVELDGKEIRKNGRFVV